MSSIVRKLTCHTAVLAYCQVGTQVIGWVFVFGLAAVGMNAAELIVLSKVEGSVMAFAMHAVTLHLAEAEISKAEASRA